MDLRERCDETDINEDIEYLRDVVNIIMENKCNEAIERLKNR